MRNDLPVNGLVLNSGGIQKIPRKFNARFSTENSQAPKIAHNVCLLLTHRKIKLYD